MSDGFWKEPTMTKTETPDGPVFTYSGGMPVDEPIPFVPVERDEFSDMTRDDIRRSPFRAVTPYSFTMKYDGQEVTLTFATLAELLDYAEGVNRENKP